MIIGLYGIAGVYNYGCEAIVRGAVRLVKDANPQSRIVYYSRRAEEDRYKLKDLDIEVCQISKNSGILSRAINKFFRIADINHRLPIDDHERICKECDAIISIGGDIYTIPEYLRKNDKYPYYNNLVQFGEAVKKHHKKLIIYGASIGPFGDFDKAKDYYFNHLKKVDVIVARERSTMKYLKDNGVEDNVLFLPDPAFFVEAKTDSLKKEWSRYLGVNLSPLSLKEIYGDVNEEHKRKLAFLISDIAKKTNLDIMLIPHVISPTNVLDNDLLFLNEIASIIEKNSKNTVKVIKDAGGFIQTKQYLSQCEIVVAARMHCAINAMCESIPTILLAYSEKAKGMARFVYGSEQWVLSLKNIEGDLNNKIDLMLRERDNIHKYLENRIADIRNTEKFQQEIKKLSLIIK